MNTIDFMGQPFEVPMANGQMEPPVNFLSDEEWFLTRAKVEGRIAADIDPSLQSNVSYLRAYIEGGMAALDARLLIPSRLADAEVPILLEWAQFTATTLRRLRQLDQEMALVDWVED